MNGKQHLQHGRHGRTAYHFQPAKNWMNGTHALRLITSKSQNSGERNRLTFFRFQLHLVSFICWNGWL
jgi:hypothetical protein